MTEDGLRSRKKAATRQQIADVAAGLFARHGYDAVSMVEVAREAGVSDQTVYNYFPAKHELVLDRADQVRGWYDEAVRDRGTRSPARALEPVLRDDVERYAAADLDEARGEFLTQCVTSPVLRRFALEERERQVRTLTDAVVATTPGVPPLLAHAHAAALVSVVQVVHDRIGGAVQEREPQDEVVAELHQLLDGALTGLDQAFTDLVGHHPTSA